MRRTLLFLLLVGCASGTGVPNNEVHHDAGEEASGVHDPSSGLCCQITDNETDGGIWHDARYECSATSGPDYSNVPWLCNYDEKDPVACTDQSCIVGSTCQGANGTGVVLACDQDYEPSDAGEELNLTDPCPGPQSGCGNLWCYPHCPNGNDPPIYVGGTNGTTPHSNPIM